jgi:hypothetical protein
MRFRKRHALLALLLLVPLGWWGAREDAPIDRAPRAGNIASRARPEDASIRASEEQRTTRRAARPPLVLRAPSEDTGTAPTEAPFEVTVYFETKSGEQLAQGYVVGCGHYRPVYVASGSSIALDDIPCSVTGLVEDGFLVRRSAAEDIESDSGDVTLTFPDERTGGIGIRISTDERGILIEDVLAGGPADDLGLEPGDVVVAVEGKDAKEISLDEFVETMTGPEGSDVEFVLQVAGDTGDEAVETVKVTRRFLGT